ncbi:MAG: LAGLIDADG family homing endonuclease, partial [Arenicellales bacterium]|nr:LAGLIDADG family homing endonuclease [Arenicellales bacterium]
MSLVRSDATATGKAPARQAEAKVSDIPLQQASVDIWDKKYRLKSKSGEVVDKDVDHTYQRVARALAAVEQSPEKKQHWYERFLWAFRHGAIPAGRIISNAGAMHHKPATSTINCTVSGLVKDSMDDILDKVHEAGLTLKAGCGIGYEFSTLRPKGAYVSGAGAYTSGPLSFMDIYDKMCFTVSSAGGRRGAQMATFDVGHPDVKDFIRAKREDGRLRQFNMSLLITEDFIEAVKDNVDWKLAFPISEKEVEDDGIEIDDEEGVIWRDWPYKKGYVTNSDGLVACKVYGTVKARRLWDMIMASTYDYAEPGFILIDKVNEMNNNWFCENVRATNPCVTADTWVHTENGPRQVHQLVGQAFRARVEGTDYDSGGEGFFLTARKPLVRIRTNEGYELRLTADHQVRRVTVFDRFHNSTEWCKAEDLRAGDRVLLNNHRANVEWPGGYNHAQGYLLGLLVGNGSLGHESAELSVWKERIAVNDVPVKSGADGVMSEALIAAMTLPHQGRVAGWQEVVEHNEYRISLTTLKELALKVGMVPGKEGITPAIESGSSRFYRGFLRGLFDADGSIQESERKGVSIKLVQTDLHCLQATQRMLLRLGIVSKVFRNCSPDGINSPQRTQGSASTKQQHELVIAGDNIVQFEQLVGFADTEKTQRLRIAVDRYYPSLNRERFTARVRSVKSDGVADVYDVQVPGMNTFDANGLHAHNCGEQPLPEYGACLLGSVNLTRFVREPFTDNAHFDWKEFREVVAVFTRMLDNVVEINGLPLGKQRQEIERKRRHGMGYLGLGSTLTMLGMRYGSPESLEFTERV